MRLISVCVKRKESVNESTSYNFGRV